MKTETKYRAVVLDTVTRLLEAVFTRGIVNKAFAYIYWRTRGDNLDDPARNGEYMFLKAYAQHAASRRVVVFDVGANIGDWTSEVLRLLPRASIYAAEPVVATYQFLSRRFASEQRVRCLNLALSDGDGVAKINVEASLSGSNSLHAVRDISWDHTEAIATRTGDSLCAQYNIDEIDLIKMDVEGHEVAVMRGWAGLIAARRIKLVQFEYNKTWMAPRTLLKDVFNLFSPHGYTVYKLRGKDIIHIPMYYDGLDNYCYSNWIVASPDAAFALKGMIRYVDSAGRCW